MPEIKPAAFTQWPEKIQTSDLIIEVSSLQFTKKHNMTQVHSCIQVLLHFSLLH
jgi:hypothetical protein